MCIRDRSRTGLRSFSQTHPSRFAWRRIVAINESGDCLGPKTENGLRIACSIFDALVIVLTKISAAALAAPYGESGRTGWFSSTGFVEGHPYTSADER